MICYANNFSLYFDLDATSKEKEVDTPARATGRGNLPNNQAQFLSLITLRDSGMSTVTKKQIDDVKIKISNKQTHLDRYEQ